MLRAYCFAVALFCANAYHDVPPLLMHEPWGLEYKCVYDVLVPHGKTTLGIRMSSRFVVQSFVRDLKDAAFGYAEATGYINIGDQLIAVNGWEVTKRQQREQALNVLQAKHSSQPLVLRFRAKSCGSIDNTPMDTAAQIVRQRRPSGRLELLGMAMNAFTKTVLDISPAGAAAHSLGQHVQADDTLLALNGMSLTNLPTALYRRVLEDGGEEQRLLHDLAEMAGNRKTLSETEFAEDKFARTDSTNGRKDVWLLRSRSAFEPEAALHLQGLQPLTAEKDSSKTKNGSSTIIVPNGMYEVAPHGHTDVSAASEHTRALGTVRCEASKCSFQIGRGLIHAHASKNKTLAPCSPEIDHEKVAKFERSDSGPGISSAATAGEAGANESASPFVSALFGGALPCYPMRFVIADPVDACSPLYGSENMTGVAVLVRRANCTFTLKAQHVQDAGAIAMIVYNVDGSPPTRMSGQGGSLLIGSSPQRDSHSAEHAVDSSNTGHIGVASVMISKASAMELQKLAQTVTRLDMLPTLQFQSMLGRSPCDNKPGATIAQDSALASPDDTEAGYSVLGASEFLRVLLSKSKTA